jgi:hypothetical protein
MRYEVEKISKLVFQVGGKTFDWDFEAQAYADRMNEKESLPGMPFMYRLTKSTPIGFVLFLFSPVVYTYPIITAVEIGKIAGLCEQAFWVLLTGFYFALCGYRCGWDARGKQP